MSATEACPACARANVSWRVACLYCGAAMPNPGPPPPPKAVPDNLDALVREAMRGGSMDAVRKALADTKPESPPPLVRPPPPVTRPPGPAGPPAPPPIAGPPPPAERAVVLAELRAAADDAVARVDDPSGLAAALDRVGERLAQARALGDPAAPARRIVVFPPIRHAHALVLDGVGDPASAADLARALEVDLATARTILSVRYTHIALRGADDAPLARRAAAVNATLPIRATVLPRSALFEVPAALAVVGRDPEGHWRVVDRSLWEEGVDPSQRPPGQPVADEPPFLAVLGEVEVRNGRAGAEPSRWLRQGYTADPVAGSARISVLDLHTRTGILRVTPATTAFDGLPGNDPTSSLRSFKRFGDALGDLYPGIRIEPRRVCAASNAAGDARYTSGWAAWEEHTRVARLHVRGGGLV